VDVVDVEVTVIVTVLGTPEIVVVEVDVYVVELKT
jgi:hypothetical protein